MRKISQNRKLWLLKHAERSARRRQRKCLPKRTPRPTAEASPQKLVHLYRDGLTKKVALHGNVRPVPKVLSLRQNYDETVEFLSQMRAELAIGYKNHRLKLARHKIRPGTPYEITSIGNYFDFAMIEKISPDVALIIASEYDAVIRKGGMLNGAINVDQWKNDVVAMLYGVGFFELVRIERPGAPVLSGTGWKMLRFRAGDQADGETVHHLLTELGVPDVVDDPMLYDAILEALTNTVHHAYPEGSTFLQPHVRDWWMTGFVMPEKRRVSISVLDHGLTIPRTLPSWTRYPRFVRSFRRLMGRDLSPEDSSSDGTAIAVAMAVGRSSTSKGYRGQGLPLIEATVDSCQAGMLRVYSRNGSYEREKGKKAIARNRNIGIAGTLIAWDWTFEDHG